MPAAAAAVPFSVAAAASSVGARHPSPPPSVRGAAAAVLPSQVLPSQVLPLPSQVLPSLVPTARDAPAPAHLDAAHLPSQVAGEAPVPAPAETGSLEEAPAVLGGWSQCYHSMRASLRSVGSTRSASGPAIGDNGGGVVGVGGGSGSGSGGGGEGRVGERRSRLATRAGEAIRFGAVAAQAEGAILLAKLASTRGRIPPKVT